ncbi:MAG: tetratricopeptide repeat protein [Bryobacteraceae bacterium]
MDESKENRGAAGAPENSHKAADEMQALANVFSSGRPGGDRTESSMQRLRPIAIWSGAGLLVVVIGCFIVYMSSRPGKAREAYAGGERLVTQGKYKEAVALFDEAVAFDSGYAGAYYARAAAYGALGEDSNVVRDLNTVLRLRPDFVDAYFRRGAIYNKRGEYRRAAGDFTKVISARPDYGNAYAQRAAVYMSLKDYPHAIADYEKAIQYDPNVDNFYQRATSYEALGEYQKALSDFNSVITLEPDVYFMYLARSNVRKALGDTAGYQADREKASELQTGR